MDIFKMMKQVNNLKKVQDEIAKTPISTEKDGVSLTITGAGEVKEFTIAQELYDKGRGETETVISSVISDSLKKQQEIQKNKAKEALGGMKIPGLID